VVSEVPPETMRGVKVKGRRVLLVHEPARMLERIQEARALGTRQVLGGAPPRRVLPPQVGPRVGVVRNIGDATGLAPAPWLTCQPDVRYIIKPSGTGMVPDAVVLGV
jgi:hypothetical protein